MTARFALLLIGGLVAGCTQSRHLTRIEPVARPGASATAAMLPLAAAAPIAPSPPPPDVGNWFVRNVFQPEGDRRSLYAVELIYCPTDKTVFSECHVAVAWSRSGKGGLGAQKDAPPSPVTDEEPPPGRVEAAAGTEPGLAKPLKTEKEPAAAQAPPPPAPERETLGQNDITNIVLANKEPIDRCIENHLKSGGATGRIVMRWAILANGTTSMVGVASKEFRGTQLSFCMARTIEAMRFPVHRKQGEPVSFPFEF